MKKKLSCTWTTISIYYNKLQKNYFKIHSYEKKKKFEKKNVQSFFIVIPVGSFVMFTAPILKLVNYVNHLVF